MSKPQTTPIFTAGLLAAASVAFVACSSDEETEPPSGALVDRSFRTDGLQEHLAAARAAKGRIFMADNAAKPGVVSRPSGLQYQIIEKGDGERPGLGDTVVTHYSVRTVDGRLIDDSEDYGEPQEFRVDKVIAGWREALQQMRVGSHWKLFLPPELAYGDTGMAQIPGGETLIYELELLGIRSGEPDPLELDPEGPPTVAEDTVPTTPTTPDVVEDPRQLSGLELREPGSEPRRGDLSLDNLDLLD